METNILNHNFTFVAPSGASYTIREQNGEDDDILSNPVTSSNLMNLSHFISAIVVGQTFYPGKNTLSAEDALKLPSNDRYAILINSRIHSIGANLEFTYDWGKDLGGEVGYEIDLNELVFNKPIEEVTDEELNQKPEAIPLYPVKQFKDIIINVDGKELCFDLLTGEGEQYLIELPFEKKTKNQVLISRNLRMKVNNSWEKVYNFRLFTKNQMATLRKSILANDPLFSGNIKIENPSNPSLVTQVNVMGLPNFFWPEGIEEQ